ncbi:MAG: hypothetical protein IJ608_09770 [Lachnospiraceae bacterium]|nr:hypothetical protein [Lachnospiraceae bacterium]
MAVLLVNVFAGRLWYVANDDFTFNFMTAGAYGDYGEYMIFINTIYGMFLKLLFKILPSVNWYLFIMLGLNLLSVNALCMCISRRLNICKASVVSLIINLILAKDFYEEVTFTHTALILAIVGLCELVLCLYEFRRLRLAVGIVFVILAGLIRTDAYIMVLPVAGISVLYLIYKNKSVSKKMFIYAGIILVPILLGKVDEVIYQFNPYSRDTMKAINLYRDVFDHVNFDAEELEIAYQNGFSDAEITLLQNYIIGDTDKFEYGRLKKLRDALYATGRYSIRISRSVLSTVCFYIYNRSLEDIRVIAALWIFVLLYAQVCGKKEATILWAGMSAYLIGMYYFFVCWNRVMWKVELGIWLAIIALFTCVMELKSTDTSRVSGIISIIIGIFAMFVYTYNIPFEEIDINAINSSEFFDTIHGRNDNYTYVTGVYALDSYENMNILTITGAYKDYFDKICLVGGWDSKMPAMLAKYEEKGIKNPIAELSYRDDLLYAGNDDEADLLVRYLGEVYEEDVGYTVVETIGDVTIYKFNKN